MTILPELRDDLARARPILPELRDGLVTARRRRRRRPVLVTGLACGTLLATAGALAATGVIGIGDPVEPRYVNRDPARGVGVPSDGSARLLPLRVADPDGGPPWGLRLAPTSRGMTCLQIGRVVDERLGVIGSDGRFHALPAAAAATGTAPCVPPDGAGRFYTAVDRTASSGGALRAPSCFERGEEPRGRPACPPDESRHVAFGLLGPAASRVTFTDGSSQTPAGDGAYLFVDRRGSRDTVLAMGGGPSVNQPFVAVARVDYRDGTSCPSAADQAFCPPKGYVEPRARAYGSVRRQLAVSLRRGKYGPEVRVSFRAPVAITQARDLYVLEARFPDSRVKRCRRVILFVPTDRNVARGERVRLTGLVGGRCTGRLVARVVLTDIARGSNGKGPAATVGRFTRTIR